MSVTFDSYKFVNFITIQTTPEEFDAQCLAIPEKEPEQTQAYGTALVMAASIGHTILIQHIVINKRKNVNSKDPSGYSALCCSIGYLQFSVMKQLIDLHADINLPGTSEDPDTTPAEFALQFSLRWDQLHNERILNQLDEDTHAELVFSSTDLRSIKLLVGLNAKYDLTKMECAYAFWFGKLQEKLASETQSIKNRIEECDKVQVLPIRDIVLLVNEYTIEEQEEPAFIVVKKQLTNQKA